jgi:deazaflavin-dependent oxidoreductase (nitroreductase family)
MDFNEMNANVIAEFRANAGKVGGWFEGQDVILVHTVGAKTGAARVNPLVCLDKGDRLIIFASKGGMPDNPDWYYNLKAHPDVTVEMGTDKFSAHAEMITGEERDRLYAEMAAKMASFSEYETKTAGIRTIPGIALVKT